MMLNWRDQIPVYTPDLSGATLLAHGELFRIGEGHLYPDDHQAPHWHDTYEIGYISRGQGVIVLGENEYPYRAGQVYIINDLQPHMGYAIQETTTLFVVHFHPAVLEESWISKLRSETYVPFLPNFNRQGPLIPTDDPATRPVRRLLDAIRAEAEARDPAWEVIVSGQIIQAVGHLARRLLQKEQFTLPEDQKRRAAMKRILPILQLIEERYSDPLSLDDIAQEGYVSRSHCCALFQTALNTTPIAYRNARRLAEARRLLQSTDLTVREIGYRVGFSTVQEFNRLFLRETGATPTAFRQRIYQRLRNIGS